jgi:hypothetical protein
MSLLQWVLAEPVENPHSVIITVEISAELSAECCWPDPAPKNWNAHTLAESIAREFLTAERFLDEWNLWGYASAEIRDSNGDTATVALS